MKTKKAIIILLCAIFSLAGCKDYNSSSIGEDITSGSETSISEGTTVNTTETTATTLSDNEQQLLGYCNDEANSYLENIKRYYGRTDIMEKDPYGFFKNISITSYTCELSSPIYRTYSDVDYLYGFAYNVRLEISESDDESFPVGTSEWTLEVEPGEGQTVHLFAPKGTTKDRLTSVRKDNRDAAGFCDLFARQFGVPESISDMQEIVPTDNLYFDNFVYSCCVFSMWDNYGSDQNFDADYIREIINKRLGVDVNLKTYKYYVPETNVLNYPAHGGNWYYCAVYSDVYDAELDTHTVVLEYYADTAYLVKAKVIEYTVMGKTDEDFKLISTDVIYDSGFELASGSI